MAESSRLQRASDADIKDAQRLARAWWQTEDATLKSIADRLRLEPWEAAELIVGDDPAVGPRVHSGPKARSYRRRLMATLARQLQDASATRHGATPRIAERLGVARRTVDDYLYDPDGRRHRQWRAERRGTCRVCGEPTTYLGPGRSAETCVKHKERAKATSWTRESAAAALRTWEATFGFRPTSSDLDRTRARSRGREALARLEAVRVPSPAALRRLYGSVGAAFADAFTAPTEQETSATSTATASNARPSS